jgi:hypothetical protein
MTDQLVVRIPEKQKFLLKNLAERRGVSLSVLVRKAISGFLEDIREENKNILADLGSLGEECVVKDAPEDLSANYKKYLYGRE